MPILVINAILGVILLFLTNLFLAEDIPIDVITVVICAILGVMGWALVLTLHLPGIASRAQKPRLLCGPAPRGPRPSLFGAPAKTPEPGNYILGP